MRFFSKQAVYRLVLERGIQENKLTGQPPIPGQYVLFQGAMANIEDEEMIKKLLNHPLYGLEFVSEEDRGKNSRMGDNSDKMEPGHIMIDMKYGTPDKTVISKQKPVFTPDQVSYMTAMAKEMAKEMVKELVLVPVEVPSTSISGPTLEGMDNPAEVPGPNPPEAPVVNSEKKKPGRPAVKKEE